MKLPSKTFCILPWIHTCIKAEGNFKLCCYGPRFSKYNINKNSIQEYWNSKEIKEVRQKMLNGEWHSACSSCQDIELMEEESNRQDENSKYKDIIENNTFSDTVDDDPIFFDIRPSNMCNLKCIMCNSSSSHLIKRNPQGKSDDSPPRIWNSFALKEIQKYLPNAERINVIGGEPTIVPEFLTLLDISNDKNIFTNINCTNTGNKFLSKLSNFQNSTVFLSVDGIGNVNDYIRFPSKWKNIEKNILAIVKKPNISFNINPTVQLLNILYLKDLLEWVNSNIPMATVTLNILFGPKCYQLKLLPKQHRHKIRDELLKFDKTSKITIKYLNLLCKMLLDDREIDSVLYEQFWKRIEEDELQNKKSFKEQLPKLYSILKNINT